jgi:MFS family permease
MFAWLRELDQRERKTLIAAVGGWATDSVDVMVFTYVIPTLMLIWGMSKVEAGWITTATVISSAIGGWLAGVLADRFGRVRILQVTILWFAVFTFLCGFTNSFEQLLVTRALQGLGFGGEWAVGSVLIGEMIRPEHRGKAVGTMQSGWAIGWGVANLLFLLLFSVLPEQIAWRALFWAGILPALLVLYIRRHVPEPEVYNATKSKAREVGSNFLEIFSPGLLKTTVLTSLMVTGMMAGYFATFFWLPTEPGHTIRPHEKRRPVQGRRQRTAQGITPWSRSRRPCARTPRPSVPCRSRAPPAPTGPASRRSRARPE